MASIKLAVVSTHPIQYYAPMFRELATDPRLDLRVFYTWSQAEQGRIRDGEFGIDLTWDLPLRDGYAHEFVPNVAPRPDHGRFFGLRTPALVPAIRAFGADAVLVFGWNSASHFGAMRALKGRIPVFFRGDSTLIDPQPAARRAVRRALLTAVYRFVDVALAVGSNNADYFRWCGVPDRRIAVVPHSIDVNRFADPTGQGATQASAWRAELGIPEDAPVALFAAKFLPKKAPLHLAEAFGASPGEAHLVFVGSGEQEPALREIAARGPRIHLLPFQNQGAMPAVYRLGDVFVLPSVGPGETWGLALNEAMASGRPVIASSRVGGARDLVRPDGTGWVFEAGDVAGLAATLAGALGEGRAGLLARGRAAAAASAAFSSAATARGIADAVVGRLAGGRG